MSITLKLDTAAVERLISSDPEALVDLQRAVVANVIRKSVCKDLGSDMSGLVARAAAGLVSDLSREAAEQLRNDALVEAVIRKLIGTEFDAAIRQGKQDTHKMLSPSLVAALQDRAAALANGIVEEKLPEMRAEIEKRFEARMERRLSDMSNEFERRLEQLGADWKAEAATRIKTDVVARLNGALAA